MKDIWNQEKISGGKSIVMYRLGIIGTGRIADRMVNTGLNGLEVECVCVYNPKIESAVKFAQKHNIKKYTDKLEEMAECVDIVYIASPHETHAAYCSYMLNKDKHVLCEKPLALKKSEAAFLYALAEQNKVVLKEAVKTAFCPGFNAVVEQVKSGKIGRVVDVEATFTRLTYNNTREFRNPVYNGSMLEFGSYCMLPIFRLLGCEYEEVDFKCVRELGGVDIYTKAEFRFKEAFATVKTGMGAKSEGQLLITGTKGYILVPSPWWMTTKFQVRYEDASVVENYETPYEGSGLQYEMAIFLVDVMKTSGMLSEDDESVKGIDDICVHKDESITMAGIMERFVKWNAPWWELCQGYIESKNEQLTKPGIWAHRGCSMRYPENTLESFEAAAKLKGITGIELDVQYTSDKQVVVFHDENVRRVTDGNRNVCEYTLEEIKKLNIYAGKNAQGGNTYTKIPTLEEVLMLLKPYCEKNGLLINIELKTSNIRYEGIERDTYDIVSRYGLQDYIVYSSFLPESVALMKKIDKNVKTGMLASYIDDCIMYGRQTNADALHPAIISMGAEIPDDFKGKPVRAWNFEEPFFEDGRELKEDDLTRYRAYGVTDIITNVPERYL